MSKVVYSRLSADGRYRVDVTQRAPAVYQLEFFRRVVERVPEYDFEYEGWVTLSWDVTFTDTPERGATLALVAMTALERQPVITGLDPDADSWLASVRDLHDRIASTRGPLPDSAPDIAADRVRDE